MELETLVYDAIKKVIPKESTRTVVYANIKHTSYEIFFYCLFPQDGYKQCYDLAETGAMDADILDTTFAEISRVIKADELYNAEKNSLFTFIIDSCGIKMNVEHLDKDARIYSVKKEWKAKNLN